MAQYIQFQRVSQIDSIARLNNSRNGNPRYLIAFTDGIIGKTKTDAGFVYAIHNGMDLVKVKFHYTSKGNCIIDDVAEVEES